MTDEQFIKWVERSGNLCILDHAKKLVERGVGSGAGACCEGREAGERQDERKGEAGRICRVAPGEAARYQAIQTAISELSETVREAPMYKDERETWLEQINRLVSMLTLQR